MIVRCLVITRDKVIIIPLAITRKEKIIIPLKHKTPMPLAQGFKLSFMLLALRSKAYLKILLFTKLAVSVQGDLVA